MKLESDEQFTKFSALDKETVSLVSLENMKDARATIKMNSEQLPTVVVFDDASNQPKMLWSAERNIEMSQIGGREDTQHFWPGADYVDEPEADHSDNQGNEFESIEELVKPVSDLARQIGNSLIAPETSINRGEVPAQQIDDWWRSAFSILERGHGDMNIKSDGF